MLCCGVLCCAVQSWLVAHKAVHLRDIWQYGYSLTFQNTAQEPLQLLKKAWTVQDMSGAPRGPARMHAVLMGGHQSFRATLCTKGAGQGPMKLGR
jgi:hypothetical protein